jgi:hypothetical protein
MDEEGRLAWRYAGDLKWTKCDTPAEAAASDRRNVA